MRDRKECTTFNMTCWCCLSTMTDADLYVTQLINEFHRRVPASGRLSDIGELGLTGRENVPLREVESASRASIIRLLSAAMPASEQSGVMSAREGCAAPGV